LFKILFLLFEIRIYKMHKNIDDVLIVGAGIAGLTAAKVLKAAGKTVKIIEASDQIGGRVCTDKVGGFLLDRGFQVLLTAYPEAKSFLDYKALDLKKFNAGALVLNESGSTEIGDPLRNPSTLLKTLLSPIGSFTDKLRMLLLKIKLSNKDIDNIFENNETTTLEYLKRKGFSERMIAQFFIPFMTGVFLESKLKTSSRMFEFVFKMFSEADTAIPADGMGMIPAQLAKKLSANDLLLNERVLKIDTNKVFTKTDRIYEAKNILIATDASNLPIPFQKDIVEKKSVTTIYFSADKPPFEQPLIALNASINKLINNIAVVNTISKAYAPEGKYLIAVSLIDYDNIFTEDLLISNVKKELKHWYPEAINWKHLQTYRIPYALPVDRSVSYSLQKKQVRLSDNCFICGDHLLNGSINAAMKTGRIAAEAIINI
jgi:protoporphyrinogen oxidase